jgi:hypothetical protein
MFKKNTPFELGTFACTKQLHDDGDVSCLMGNDYSHFLLVVPQDHEDLLDELIKYLQKRIDNV